MAADPSSGSEPLPVADRTEDEVGQRLRDARQQSGLSLRQLAKRLDVSASALSQIETGKSRPSVRTLYAVVSELGLSLDELFRNQQAPARADEEAAPIALDRPADSSAPDSSPTAESPGPMMHEADRPRLELDTGVSWERLTTEHDELIDFLHVVYEPGSASNSDGKLVRHSGREYGVVMTGHIDVTIGFQTFHLGPGDSISFSSDEPHVLANRSTEPATAIWFVVGRRQSDARQPRFDDAARPAPPAG
jgi:transcriptional regulator with XRE-family HTH domain